MDAARGARCVAVYACMHACMYVCMHACIYVYMCNVCMHVCVCVSAGVCMLYACMYVCVSLLDMRHSVSSDNHVSLHIHAHIYK